METITVTYNGNRLSLYKELADTLNIKQGYTIKSEDEFWDLLYLNCNFGKDRINLLTNINTN
jgi:hypothetical protein